MTTTLDRSSPKVCLSLTEKRMGDDLALVERERARIDIVELRVDFLEPSELDALPSFPRRAGLPAILAFRRRRDGGVREIAEKERMAILESALSGGWAFVDLDEDLEAPALEAAAARAGTRIIRSFYDCSGLPQDLATRLPALARSSEEVPKVAVMPRSVRDLLSLLDAAEGTGSSPAIVVGMGEWGFATRVLPRRFSSALTYCTAGEAKAAPGHVDPFTLREIYRVGEASSSARLFCVIGNPVLHSRSPWIHNPGFRSLGIDAVYLPIQVDNVEDFLVLAERMPIDGASVTVPHKEKIRGALTTSDASVEQAGACNTLVKGSSGWQGYNTDIAGFLSPLRARLGDRLTGKRALVVGAGGAARAVVAGLTSAGCAVAVVNRTEARAQELAKEFDCDWLRPAGLEGEFEIIVQSTSAGMSPNLGIDPLPGYRFRGTEVVYELIYAPPRTRFVERAEHAGCTVIGGREMLLHQAYAQFRLFTGREYPRGAAEPGF